MRRVLPDESFAVDEDDEDDEVEDTDSEDDSGIDASFLSKGAVPVRTLLLNSRAWLTRCSLPSLSFPLFNPFHAFPSPGSR